LLDRVATLVGEHEAEVGVRGPTGQVRGERVAGRRGKGHGAVRRSGLQAVGESNALALAGLFELRITHLENESRCADIEGLVEKLGGDPEAMFYGAQ